MGFRPISFVAALIVAGWMIAGCTQAVPATPTQPPVAPAKAAEPTKAVATAAPTKAAEPTKAPAPQPTAAPKVTFPEKGRALTVIVPWAAGGSVDLGVRVLAPSLEKELGIPVQIVNRGGATGQIGLTELAGSKPDGYTIGVHSLPVSIVVYMDPERKAVYSRKDFELIANHVMDVGAVGVRADSPYKSMKDLVDAAKAQPEKIKLGTTGLLSIGHLTGLMLEKETKVKFGLVHFEGSAADTTALMGGHVDTVFGTSATFSSLVRSNEVRLLGIMSKEESAFYPGVKTLASQGYNIDFAMSRGFAAPAGAPKEAVDVLSRTIGKIVASDEHKTKMDEMLLPLKYMNAAEYSAYWRELETQVQPLLELAKEPR